MKCKLILNEEIECDLQERPSCNIKEIMDNGIYKVAGPAVWMPLHLTIPEDKVWDGPKYITLVVGKETWTLHDAVITKEGVLTFSQINWGQVNG